MEMGPQTSGRRQVGAMCGRREAQPAPMDSAMARGWPPASPPRQAVAQMHTRWAATTHTRTTLYAPQVPPETYVWPMMGFATAFCLNVVMLAFERESVKFQLALLACLINCERFSQGFGVPHNAVGAARQAR